MSTLICIGQDFPYPISKIGPRMTPNGMGWTIVVNLDTSTIMGFDIEPSDEQLTMPRDGRESLSDVVGDESSNISRMDWEIFKTFEKRGLYVVGR